MKDRFEFDAAKSGMLLAAMGLVMAVVQGGLIGPLSKKVAAVRLVATGTIISAIALVFFALSRSPLEFMVALTVMALSQGLVQPSLSALASRGAPDHLRGATMGIFHSAGSLSRVFGPPLAGWLYDHQGISSPFLMGALILGSASLLAGLNLKKLLPPSV